MADFGLRTYQGEGYVFDDSETGVAGVDLGLRTYQGDGLVYEVQAAAGAQTPKDVRRFNPRLFATGQNPGVM